MGKQKESARQALWERIDSLISKDWSSHLQMAGLTFLLLTIQIWQLRGYGRLSLYCFLIGIVCLCEASSTAIRFKQNLQLYFQRNTILLLFLESISLLFLIVNHSVIEEGLGISSELFLIFALAIVIVSQSVQLICTANKWKPSKAAMKEALLIGILCFIFGFVLNIECFNTWPRWDSYKYYWSFEHLSPLNIFSSLTDGLKICGHIGSSYILWSFLFMSIPGLSTLNALYLSNMMLEAIDLFLVYLIFKHLIQKESILRNAVFAIVCVCSPLVFGLVADINSELFMVTGVLLLLYAIFKGNGVLEVLATYAVCMAREPGALVAAAIIFVQLLFSCIHKIRCEKQETHWSVYILCFSIGFTWLLQYMGGHWGSGSNSYYVATWDGVELNQFAFSKIHIQDVLTGSMLSNFNWIYLVFVLFSLSIFLWRLAKKKYFSILISKPELWLLIVPLLVYVVTICAYVTWHVYRYFAISTVLLHILGLYGLYYTVENVWKKPSINCIFALIVGGLVLTQNFLSIDPVTRWMYSPIDIGNTVIVPMPAHVTSDVGLGFTDSAYTRQVMYLEKALDKVYATVYEEGSVHNTKILCSDEYVSRILPDGRPLVGSLCMIWGFGYTAGSFPPPRWGAWNSNGGYRYLSYDFDDAIDPSYVLADTDLSDYLNNYEHVYYVKMPWGDTVLKSLMERYSGTSLYQTIEYRGWVLEVYRIK